MLIVYFQQLNRGNIICNDNNMVIYTRKEWMQLKSTTYNFWKIEIWLKLESVFIASWVFSYKKENDCCCYAEGNYCLAYVDLIFLHARRIFPGFFRFLICILLLAWHYNSVERASSAVPTSKRCSNLLDIKRCFFMFLRT